VITDKIALLKLIEQNVKNNVPNEASLVRVEELLWGSKNTTATYDIVLGADLTYDFEDLQPLLQTLDVRSLCYSTIITTLFWPGYHHPGLYSNFGLWKGISFFSDSMNPPIFTLLLGKSSNSRIF